MKDLRQSYGEITHQLPSWVKQTQYEEKLGKLCNNKIRVG